MCNLQHHLLEQIASFVGVFQVTPQGYQKMTVEAVRYSTGDKLSQTSRLDQ